MKEFARTFVPPFIVAILLSLGIALGCAVAFGQTGMEPAGSDVFTTPREAVLRDKGTPQSRVLARLPQGTRLALLEGRARFLRVEAVGVAPAWISRDVVVIFAPDPGATRDLVSVGRSLGANEANRRLAAALLQRASDRYRDAKTPDPEVEVLLGETIEGLAGSRGPFPKGLGIVEKSAPAGTDVSYDGAAFQRALELLRSDQRPESAGLRERALAGCVRARFPEHAATFQGLMEETAAWLELLEAADNAAVLRSATVRGGGAAVALGRYLLALGKIDELGKLAERVRHAGLRVQSESSDALDGRRLLSRAAILRAIRGNGAAPFPQEARVVGGSRERLVRVDGKLGALVLTVETRAGGTRDVRAHTLAIPVLPVPGSLRISPDGRTVAWVEATGPSHLVPIMTSLERDEPAREIAFLADGRPMRDRELSNVVASLAGFSRDGQRLGLSLDAWNDTPGPAPRYSVVSVATGELLYETSTDLKSFQRLLQ